MTDCVVGSGGKHRAAPSWLRVISVLALGAGCAGTGEAPPPFALRQAPEALFLVHNELFSIRVDGTDRRSRGTVGDNKWRTGWPRRLPDGRAIVLGDEAGAIYPFFESNGRLLRLSSYNVTLNDSLCGVPIDGEPRMVLTATPFVPTRTAVQRIDVDNPTPELMHLERQALIANPAPYDDGRVVAVRYAGSATEIVVIDVASPMSPAKQPTVLATVPLPYYASTPARLPDGRVVFIHLDAREVEDQQLGEMWVIDSDGVAHPTGIDGIVSLVVIDDWVVYETRKMDKFSDVVATNLTDPPINMTATPFVSEHLGWSD